MERWKRNVLSLFPLFGMVYGAYLLWLYEGSGGSMVVTYEMPEWTFPFLAGMIVFAISFGGGIVGLTLTNPDLSREREGLLQIALLSLFLGVASTVVSFWMLGFLSPAVTLTLLAVTLAPILLVAKARRKMFTPSVPVTDERERFIWLKSRALAGDILMSSVAVLMLLSIFDKSWKPDLQALFLCLIAIWAVSELAARAYLERVM